VARGAPQEKPTDPISSDTPIGASGLPGAASLRRHGARLGIATVRDLLTTFPRRYQDLREVTSLGGLGSIESGAIVTIRASVVSIRIEPGFGRRTQRTVAVVRDDTGTVEAVWFGRRYIEQRLDVGDDIVASGKAKRRDGVVTIDNPEFEKADSGDLLHAGRIVPVYRLTRGVSARVLRSAIRAGLDRIEPLAEYLPEDALGDHISIAAAIEWAHYPDRLEDRDAALSRLASDELLALQLGMVARRRQRSESHRNVIAIGPEEDAHIRKVITAGLVRRVGRPVELTADQNEAMEAVRADLHEERPMLRLIQGDVGSGKTAVAAYALATVERSGGQGALLAPTELLARQLAETVSDLLADADIAVTLLTGSLSGRARRAALDNVASGGARVVVGTQALLQEGVSYARLELVVIDEQHRFGVAQREALAAKSETPHVLLMTATPIPRTLGQVLYADLDVTDLRTPPVGRKKVATGIRSAADLDGTWGQVRHEAEAGRRTFVVVPHIDPLGSDEPAADMVVPPSLPIDRARGLEAATGAEEVVERLRTELTPLRVGLVHGRMKAADRDAEMTRFRDGEMDVLVGTTVVEVGVDVPEATVMVVLSADRFGLSQLHQLRGRVGRGEASAYCVLVTDVSEDSLAWARIRTIVGTHDGFELAEKDWELRGEGDVLGLTQSGLPRLRVASLAIPAHRELAVRSRELAERLLDEHGELRPGAESLRHELEHGWLAAIVAGETATDESVGA
jgi:ATP-dependent DNA helicase RecG